VYERSGRRLIGATAMLLLFVQAGCSEAHPYVIKPTGRLDQSVIFQFVEPSQNGKPVGVNVSWLSVQELTGDRWVQVWELRGSRRVESITYGEPLDGLPESGPEKRLMPDSKYRLSVDGGWVNGTGQVMVWFAFDPNGAVQVIEQPIPRLGG
jgi:hypothetical protein